MGIFQADSKTETQKYEVLKSEHEFEIRYYPPAVLASVEMEGSWDESRNGSFGVLAGYIFGGNDKKMKISMTSPVRMSEIEGTMSFVMPSQYTLENLPEPGNNRIRLHASQPVVVAAIRFGGWANEERIGGMKDKLSEWIQKEGHKHTGKFEYLGYNPPFQLTNRRNEVVVELSGYQQNTGNRR